MDTRAGSAGLGKDASESRQCAFGPWRARGRTEKLEEAVTAYRAALEELTRERVPLDWAASLGNQGVVMMRIAERTNDGALAETAVVQIAAAYETQRDGGPAQSAAYYEEQLPKAQAIRDRLKGE
jgi:hypothetical protein